MGVLSAEGGLVLGVSEQLVAKDCCAASYLRGAFLGSGFVSDPRGDFHFEVIVETEELADGLVELLARKNIKARIMQRRNSYMVYLKSGSAILEFLALAGAHQNALAMENARVIKSVRNDVNRQTNAEIANQAKTLACRDRSDSGHQAGGRSSRHGEPPAGAAGFHQASRASS